MASNAKEKEDDQLYFYVIANSDGQYYRRKGYGGYGSTWVDKIDTARIYVKIGQARRQVTYFALNFPAYPAPKIVKLKVIEAEVIDETERIEKAKIKKQKSQEQKELREKKRKLDQAQRDLEAAKKRYGEVKRDVKFFPFTG